MLSRGRQVRGSDGDSPFLAPSHSAGLAKRKRPPKLDIAAISSWQPRHTAEGEQAEPPLGPRVREGSPRRVSCPQTVAASPSLPDRLFKRARRPGLTRCRSVPDFGSAVTEAEAEAVVLRDDCAASIISPRFSGLDVPSFSQADQLAALSAQLGSSSLCSPSSRSSPDSVVTHG